MACDRLRLIGTARAAVAGDGANVHHRAVLGALAVRELFRGGWLNPASDFNGLRIRARWPMESESQHVAVTMPEQQARCVHELNVVEAIHRKHHVALAEVRV